MSSAGRSATVELGGILVPKVRIGLDPSIFDLDVSSNGPTESLNRCSKAATYSCASGSLAA